MISYTGIHKPYDIGEYSVERNAKVLQRYRFMHEGLLRVMAGQLPARGDWDLKLGLCRHMYENAEAANALRGRIPELRTSSAVLGKEPDAVLSLLIDELIHAENDLELTAGIYAVVKPALLETYRRHMATTQQIVDQPTLRILRTIVLDLEEQVTWGCELQRMLEDSGVFPAHEPFTDRLRSYIAAAGGIDSSLPKTTELPPRERSTEPYRLPLRSVRDPRTMGPVTWARTSMSNAPDDEMGRRVVATMRVRQEEMTACELVSGVLYSQRQMPWSFHRDLARHVWDEARHAMFGQAALEAEGYDWKKEPQYTSDYDVNEHKLPGAQYAWLSIGIEEGAMVSNGKKKEFEYFRDEAKHPLMQQFQDYDWADEVVHANLGRKWVPELLEEEIAFVREVAKKELDHFWSEVNKATEQWRASKAGNE
ncbi:hypothetical protein BG53_09185 [Paenibacillus darwinianus]|uniref:Ferritin-like domain-containing protein n=1 Tax=Paenibacillus darwinianus TaxID=1380763 RepID=A0A9W5RZ43_9BACL|nr:hypothetical protein [Paenibacillus darwinianus]EXX85213.1 hypothetical protein BG53_09185 [Paenibacillus darwinianus]EXX85274.1 hypothetical protein CH50_09845 [Paenibacillus darwinianus]EXX85462.1 hypothetical protein BG52_08450 [Paenibacillus darwinianus]